MGYVINQSGYIVNEKECTTGLEEVDSLLVNNGERKDKGEIKTWDAFADVMNNATGKNMTESYWRKRLKKLRGEPLLGKEEVIATDEVLATNRKTRSEARCDNIIDLFEEKIESYKPFEVPPVKVGAEDRAVYAMLSDIHYGLTFHNFSGSYDSELAVKRVMKYAKEIVAFGEREKINDCYVSLMGDLISGNIHSTIRLENRENITQQVVGVSQLISEFLHELAQHFRNVYVNSVSGNHSRLEKKEDALRTERMDDLVVEFVKLRLRDVNHVQFQPNLVDCTVATIGIFGVHYLAVHGDLEYGLQESAARLQNVIGERVDYILAGHTHVVEARLDGIANVIKNGCVCGSGDEYTMKKRLFGKPMQAFLVVNEFGVESIHPVNLNII